MESEKRMIDTYEVLNSLKIGSREIFVAENLDAADGEKYMVGYAVINGIREVYSDCAVSDDYIEIIEDFGKRIVNEAQLHREKIQKLELSDKIITSAECFPIDESIDIHGKIVAMKASSLRPEYRRADRQLYLVTGGFGASANSRGRAVFCTNLHTGEKTRFERYQVLGEVKPECMPEWAKTRIFAMSSQKVFHYGGLHYIPYRVLSGKETKSDFAIRHCRADTFQNERSYDYSDFYANSTEQECDLFLCVENGKLYLPGENYLFLWDGEKGKCEFEQENKSDMQKAATKSAAHKNKEFER